MGLPAVRQLTAAVTATAATCDAHGRQVTSVYPAGIRLSWAAATPEKRTVVTAASSTMLRGLGGGTLQRGTYVG